MILADQRKAEAGQLLVCAKGQPEQLSKVRPCLKMKSKARYSGASL